MTGRRAINNQHDERRGRMTIDRGLRSVEGGYKRKKTSSVIVGVNRRPPTSLRS